MKVTKVTFKPNEHDFIGHVGEPLPLQARLWNVVIINGKHMICDHNGIVVPGLHLTVISQNCQDMATVKAEFLVNLREVESIEEYEEPR